MSCRELVILGCATGQLLLGGLNFVGSFFCLLRSSCVPLLTIRKMHHLPAQQSQSSYNFSIYDCSQSRAQAESVSVADGVRVNYTATHESRISQVVLAFGTACRAGGRASPHCAPCARSLRRRRRPWGLQFRRFFRHVEVRTRYEPERTLDLYSDPARSRNPSPTNHTTSLVPRALHCTHGFKYSPFGRRKSPSLMKKKILGVVHLNYIVYV